MKYPASWAVAPCCPLRPMPFSPPVGGASPCSAAIGSSRSQPENSTFAQTICFNKTTCPWRYQWFTPGAGSAVWWGRWLAGAAHALLKQSSPKRRTRSVAAGPVSPRCLAGAVCSQWSMAAPVRAVVSAFTPPAPMMGLSGQLNSSGRVGTRTCKKRLSGPVTTTRRQTSGER